MKKYFVLLVLVSALLMTEKSIAQTYKYMMADPNVNFYDVVKEADKYFENRDKGKGSGWAPYQRWKHLNESRFYPSGVRNQSSPYFAQEAFTAILKDKKTSHRK